jgi:hypothetical protein
MKSPGSEFQGKTEGVMRIRNWAPGIRVHASVGVAVMAVSSWLGAAAEAQEESKRKVQKKERNWKLTVVSEVVPGKIGTKLTARIEGDMFVCGSPDVPLFEIPLKTVTEISRDDDKDYAASRWLMNAARQRPDEHHPFGSKAYREDLEARMGLTLLGMFASLFPTHKEVIRLRWTDAQGQHDADFYLERTEGRALLVEIKKQTGLEPRDLEKERKEEEKRLKSLQRQNSQRPSEVRGTNSSLRL